MNWSRRLPIVTKAPVSMPMTKELVLKRILGTWYGKLVAAAKAMRLGRCLIERATLRGRMEY